MNFVQNSVLLRIVLDSELLKHTGSDEWLDEERATFSFSAANYTQKRTQDGQSKPEVNSTCPQTTATHELAIAKRKAKLAPVKLT